VVKENFVAAKLTGDDPPTAAENLKLVLTVNADAKSEAFHCPKRIINVSNWVIATDDNNGPVQRLDHWQPGDCFGASLPLTKKFLGVDPPKPIVTYDLGSVVVTGQPGSALSAVREGKADRIGLVLLGYDLRSNKRSQIRGKGCFADY
jgi:hypothetical protein